MKAEDEKEFHNKGVEIIHEPADEAAEALEEYRKKMAGLLDQMMLPSGQNFDKVFEGQDDLDAQFAELMDEEYNDDQIGELEEEEVDAED